MKKGESRSKSDILLNQMQIQPSSTDHEVQLPFNAHARFYFNGSKVIPVFQYSSVPVIQSTVYRLPCYCEDPKKL